MKPRNSVRMEKSLFVSCTLLLGTSLSLCAAEIKKNNNTSNLSTTGAWSGAVVPTLNDVAVWDNTILTAANCTNPPGANLFFGGIRVSNPPAPCKINAGSNPAKIVTLGSFGVNMTNSTQDFFLEGQTICTNSASLNIASGVMLRHGNYLDFSGGTTITFNGPGTIEGANAGSSAIRVGGTGAGDTVFNHVNGTIRCLRSGSGAVVLNIARFATTPATYNMIGGTLSGDLISDGIIRIGDEQGALGTVNVTGGTFAGSVVDVGNNGTAVINISGSGVMTVSGNLNIPRGAAPAAGQVNLDGGSLTIGRAAANNTTVPGAGTFNFNGGLLRPNSSRTDFMFNLAAANVKEGGARIDTAGFDVTIAQALLHGGSAALDGGLTKSGTGTLTLTGAGTYNGPTRVTDGKLAMGTAYLGGSTVQVSDGAAFRAIVSTSGGTLYLPSLALGSVSGATCEFDLGVFGNATAPVLWVTNLATAGSVTINVTGVGLMPGQFPLFKYSGTIGGSGYPAISLGTLPTDVIAQLVHDPVTQTVYLNVTSAPSLTWTGSTSGDWDLFSLNWTNLNGIASAYTEGYPVQFDDTSSAGAVNLTIVVSPAKVTINNTTQSYTFTGLGQIAGACQLVKQGSGTLTLVSSNAYAGDTVISAGTVSLGASEVIPHGTGYGNVQLNGKLDLAGFNESINGLSGAGTVDNSGGAPVTFTAGAGNASGSFSGTVQNTGAAVKLIKVGSGGLMLSGNNTFSGGMSNSAGLLLVGGDNALGTGTFEITGGTISAYGTAPRAVPNNIVIFGDHNEGSLDNTGVLTFAGNIDLSTGTRAITVNSDVVWAGYISNGGINKLGNATLTFKNAVDWYKDSEVRQGTLVLDGTTFNNSLSFRPDANLNLGTARLVITNGASVNFSAPDANLRAGFDANVQSTNIIDVAGSVRYSAGAASNNGRMLLGTGCALGVINLWPGADVECSAVLPSDTTYIGASELNFRGGLLRVRSATAAYMQGLTRAQIWEGLTIDTAGYDITIAQPLLARGSGGITKLGTSMMKLTGAGTYTGTTLVQEGRLSMSTVHTGGGPVLVQDGASFGVQLAAAGSTLAMTAVTVGSSQGASLEFYLNGFGTPSAPVLYATNLTTRGQVVINVDANGLTAGTVFPLIRYQGAIAGGGFSAFTLGRLPQGVTAALVNNPQSVDLHILTVTPLLWTGSLSGDWDISSTANWNDGVSAAVYQEFSIPGSGVLFNDSAQTANVNVTTVLSPSSLVVSNNSLAYNFSGLGRISGPVSLVKQGSGTLTVAMAETNDYAGDTRIESGTLVLGNGTSIPDGANKGDLLVNGTLDVAGQSETINGLQGTGAVGNPSGLAAVLTVGSNGVSSTFSGTIRDTSLALAKVGAGSLTLTSANTYGGGTTATGGKLFLGSDTSLGSGLLTLSAGAVASDGASPRTISNPVKVTTASTMGDPTNTGKLTFTGPIDFSTAARNITFPTDVDWTGTSTNGRLNKLGTGTLAIKESFNWNGDAEVREGTLITTAPFMTNSGTLRPDANGGVMYCRLAFGSGTYIEFTAPNANLRAGYDGQPGSTNQLDLAGVVRMPFIDSSSGNLVAGRNNTYGIINLFTGADIMARTVALGPSAAGGQMHFNGGILRGLADRPDFMQGIDLVTLETGGITIDTAGWSLGVVQPLQDGSGPGTLTKIGDGTLALNGTNAYTGLTLVSQGTLAGTGLIAGPVTVSPGAALSPGAPFGTLTLATTPTLQGTTLIQIGKTGTVLSSGTLKAPALNRSGALVVTNSGPDALAAGDTFTLFDTAGFTGSGFSSTILPAGYTWDTSQLYVNGTIRVVSTATTPLLFTAYSISGSNLTLAGTGGTPGASFSVLMSTNATLAPANWTSTANSAFDGSGNFNLLLPLPAGPMWFFRIAVP